MVAAVGSRGAVMYAVNSERLWRISSSMEKACPLILSPCGGGWILKPIREICNDSLKDLEWQSIDTLVWAVHPVRCSAPSAWCSADPCRSGLPTGRTGHGA